VEGADLISRYSNVSTYLQQKGLYFNGTEKNRKQSASHAFGGMSLVDNAVKM